jgi:thiol-disulfide isomerase/thioredoxin
VKRTETVQRAIHSVSVVLAWATLLALPALGSGATGASDPIQSSKEFLNSSYGLYKSGDFEAALSLIDEGMAHYPEERISFLNLKYMVLDKTDDVEQLIATAVERADFFVDSPKKSREVVLAYLRNGDSDNASRWLEITLERGYQDHADLLLNPAYEPLRRSESFKNVERAVGQAIGIDQKAKGFEGLALDGSSVALEDHLGKVVLVDFWAVYCGPCLAEIDSMLTYYPELKGEGLEIVSINLDEDRATVTKYVDENKVPWPVIYSGKGWDDDIRAAYGLANIPSYWLVDRAGTLRYVGLQGELLKQHIELLLAE